MFDSVNKKNSLLRYTVTNDLDDDRVSHFGRNYHHILLLKMLCHGSILISFYHLLLAIGKLKKHCYEHV